MAFSHFLCSDPCILCTLILSSNNKRLIADTYLWHCKTSVIKGAISTKSRSLFSPSFNTDIWQGLKHVLDRSSHRRCSTQILQSSHVQSLFFNKVYWKRDSGIGVFLWILWDFWEHLFQWTPLNDCFCPEWQ